MAKILLIACVLAITGATSARAQEGQTRTRLVLGAGLGIAGGDTETEAGTGITGHAGWSAPRFLVRLDSRNGGDVT
jgi:hypothetical protein